jgi:hypothetical protein
VLGRAVGASVAPSQAHHILPTSSLTENYLPGEVGLKVCGPSEEFNKCFCQWGMSPVIPATRRQWQEDC